VDVRSVGAGGGSIAWIDPGGLLRVGPQSAGAVPGPACYGRGGTQATVTDAALVLGYLDPAWFLGGRMTLDVDAARAAVGTIAEPLSLSPEAAAFTILTVANETMIQAIKEITVNEGVNPAEAVLVAGGGAAGLGILPIARELGCRSVVVPRAAGALSACGMHFSDLVSEHSASVPVRSGAFDIDAVNDALDRIDMELDRFARPLEDRGFAERTITYTVAAHYAAQVWELDVPLPVRRFATAADAVRLALAFHEAHQRVFAVRDEASEIDYLRWTGRVTLQLGAKSAPATSELRAEARPARRSAWFGVDSPHEADVWRGSDVVRDQTVCGPAIIEEDTSTLVLPPGATARLSPHGCYVVDVGRYGVEEEAAA
jgi:N-methylhydantoinase A